MEAELTPPPGVSIVVCCFNSGGRLPPTLAHLATQQVSLGLPWEVIVVDNASTDGTGEAAVRMWPSDPPASLRVVREPRPGLSAARERGFEEAKYSVVSFVDDDNWVCPEWVERVAKVFLVHDRVAVCGAATVPAFEAPPPVWFERFHGHLAIGAQSDTSGDITDTRGLVWGAGMSVRKAAWSELRRRGFRFWMTDRVGGSLVAGGDCELCFGLRLAGWRVWYDSELTLTHYMPAGRLTWEYLLRLAAGSGQSDAWADGYRNVLSDQPRRMGWSDWMSALVVTAWRYIRVTVSDALAPTEERAGSVRGFNRAMYRARFGVLLDSRRRLFEQWTSLLDMR